MDAGRIRNMSLTLESDDEVLFRQVNPSFYDKGEPSSQPFMPTSKDENKLSVDRSGLTDAKQSYELFVGNGYKSSAVYGLSVGEFKHEDLPSVSDPIPASPGKAANPAHAYANYSNHSAQEQKRKAKRLKHLAISRGCLYQP